MCGRYGRRADKQRIAEWMQTHNVDVFDDSYLTPSYTNLPSTIEYSSGLIDNPREGGHGSKLLWRFVQMAQACLDGIHHLVQGVEDLIVYIVFANVLPDVFGGIQFRRVGRQGKQSHVGRHGQFMGLVPSGSIEKHDAVFVRKLRRGLGQKDAHQTGIDPGQNHRRHLAVGGAHGHISVHIFADQLAADCRPQGQRRPTASRVADASETAFVLKQHTHLCVCWKALGYGLESLRKFFLKASASA